MKTIQISKYTSSNLNYLFSSVNLIEIEDKPFDSGAFGEVYFSKKINGQILPTLQVVKIFIDDGSGSSKRGLKTIEQLQEQIVKLNKELKSQQKTPIENIVALGALPQFSFEGRLNGKTVLGYSANFLDKQWLLFDKIFNEEDISKKRKYRNNFYNLPLGSRLNMAYQLAEGFSYLARMNFIYADLNPKNFFVNTQENKLCLIDYEGGAVMDSRGNSPETYGKLGEWLAPEIQKQLTQTNSGLIKVNLHTDTWAVAIGIHFMLFNYHPLSYLAVRGEKIKEYLQKFKYPQIDKNDANYRKDFDDTYNKYVTKLQTQIPQEIVKAFEATINDGYKNPNLRISYKQWLNIIGNHRSETPYQNPIISQLKPPLQGNPSQPKPQSQQTKSIVSPPKPKLPKPVINSFTADASVINKGDSVILRWNVSNFSKILLNERIKYIDVSGQSQYRVNPLQDTTYKIIVTALDNKTTIEREIEIKIIFGSKYCNHCGREYDTLTSKFCSKCGKERII